MRRLTTCGSHTTRPHTTAAWSSLSARPSNPRPRPNHRRPPQLNHRLPPQLPTQPPFPTTTTTQPPKPTKQLTTTPPPTTYYYNDHHDAPPTSTTTTTLAPRSPPPQPALDYYYHAAATDHGTARDDNHRCPYTGLPVYPPSPGDGAPLPPPGPDTGGARRRTADRCPAKTDRSNPCRDVPDSSCSILPGRCR